MIRRYSYLRAEGFTLPEAVEIVNRETASDGVRLVKGPICHPTWQNASERSTAPLVGLLVRRACLVVGILAGMWVYGQV